MFKKMLSQFGNGLNEYHGWFIETVDSPDDGGWYCLVVNDSGVDVGETDVHKKKDDAVQQAKMLIDSESIPMY